MFQIELRPQVFEFVTNLCQQKRPDNKRHVVVFMMIDKLKHAAALGLKAIVTQSANNAIFILRNEFAFHVPSIVRSVLQPVPCLFDAAAFCPDFFDEIQKECPSDINIDDPMNICIAAELPFHFKFDALAVFVSDHMTRLIEVRDQGCLLYTSDAADE